MSSLYYFKNFKKLANDFRRSPVKIENGALWIGDSLQVSEWEKPFQKKLAQICLNKKEGNILEIGYGLGMASNILAASNIIKSYSLIEAHPQIFSTALNTIGEVANFTGYYSFWEVVVTKMSPKCFDSILFDAYLPLFDNKADSEYKSSTIKKYLLESLPHFSRILSKEGILVFVDVTNDIEFSAKELLSTNFHKLKKKKVGVVIPDRCPNYCNDDYVTLIQLEAL
ncbi:MAG: hypothetical protein K8R67_03805 [Desulfobacteraceae bacterium]|nr:hypothetical protein [Desulfobacteraceae bacterium]